MKYLEKHSCPRGCKEDYYYTIHTLRTFKSYTLNYFKRLRRIQKQKKRAAK